MQFLILGLLLARPLSLYDVHKHFSAGISLLYAASFGSIQRALEQLVAKGWVARVAAADARRNKKLYVISDSGRAAWHAWMLDPITVSDPGTTILAKVYLLGFLPAADRPACLAQLRRRVAADADQLAGLADSVDPASVPPDAQEAFRFQRATLDHGIRENALTLRWLNELEE